MDNDPSTRHVLEGRELIDYLVEKAAGATNTEMLHREERRNRRTTALLSVLGFVGIGAIVGAIKMFVQQEISLSEQRVRQHVTQSLAEDFDQRGIAFERTITDTIAARVDDQVGAVRKELQNYKVYQELLAHTEVIAAQAAEGKVADQALKLSLEAINTLAGVEAIKGQPRFLDAVNVVVDVLVRTDRKREINEVELLLNDVLGLQKDIALDLADHYGEIIVASPYAIEELGVESEALARYAAASREHKYPEKALMWELFVAYKANDFRPNRTTQGMVEMARDLNRQDLNEFCYQIVLHTNPYHWMGVPDHEGRELAKMTNQLLRDHVPLREMVQKQSSDEHLAPRLVKLAERRQRYTGHADDTPVEPAAPAVHVPATPPQVATNPAEAADNNALRR